ncbi:putative PurR-regulated permease PerM [Mariniflexile fucanivorans]|uniref:Putative PurR-regulated permease PerM n=1 Tax=Mariniflexile fucanivorans TaxID=264023 RepID=A0A4R1RJE1_9FLAO|nr:AI-2E family transporter [Mariniflexile fucanivorans]TCL66096.1 putative PurR-regulated permease PerM [Mariniflexile fucanivorans]
MNTKNHVSHSALSLISLIAVVFILYILKPFIVPIIFAIILSVMIFPIQRFLERKWRCNRLFATLTSLFTLFILTSLLFYVISTRLMYFMDNSEIYSQKLGELFHKSVNSIEQTLNIRSNRLFTQSEFKAENIIKDNLDNIGLFLTESSSLISDLVLIPIYIFFFLYYRAFFRTFVYKAFKSKPKSFINNILKKIYAIQQNYLLGLIKVIIIVGCLNSLGLVLLGIGNPFFFGFLAAILLLIPYIGVIIGSLLPAIIALATKDSAWYAFGVIAVFGFIQFLEGNFITPKITGSKVSVNAFVVITSLVLFSMLWGITGMILALPITATLKILFDNTPGYEAYGFLIGEPVDKHLQNKAQVRLKKWKRIRKAK